MQAGPVASILIDYKIEDALQVPLEVDYNTSTIGYQAGIGLDIGNLILDLKYEIPWVKFQDQPPLFQLTKDKIKLFCPLDSGYFKGILDLEGLI